MDNLLVFQDLAGLNWPQFFAVYRESSVENAAAWYPELSEEEVQRAKRKYISGLTPNCINCGHVWGHQNVWFRL